MQKPQAEKQLACTQRAKMRMTASLHFLGTARTQQNALQNLTSELSPGSSLVAEAPGKRTGSECEASAEPAGD